MPDMSAVPLHQAESNTNMLEGLKDILTDKETMIDMGKYQAEGEKEAKKEDDDKKKKAFEGKDPKGGGAKGLSIAEIFKTGFGKVASVFTSIGSKVKETFGNFKEQGAKLLAPMAGITEPMKEVFDVLKPVAQRLFGIGKFLIFGLATVFKKIFTKKGRKQLADDVHKIANVLGDTYKLQKKKLKSNKAFMFFITKVLPIIIFALIGRQLAILVKSFKLFKRLFKSKWVTKLGGWIIKPFKLLGGFFKRVFGKGSKLGKFLAPIGRFFRRIGTFFSKIGKIFKGSGKIGKIFKVFGKGIKIFGKVFKFIGKIFKIIGKVLFKIFKFLKPVLKMAGAGSKAIPVVGQIIMVIMTVIDFFVGFFKAGKIFGKGVTLGQKFIAGFAGIISGLTFGLLKTKDIALWIDSAIPKLLSFFTETIPNFFGMIKDKIVAIFADSFGGKSIGATIASIIFYPFVLLKSAIKIIFPETWKKIKMFFTEFIPNLFKSIGGLIKGKLKSFFGFGGDKKKADVAMSGDTTNEFSSVGSFLGNKTDENVALLKDENDFSKHSSQTQIDMIAKLRQEQQQDIFKKMNEDNKKRENETAKNIKELISVVKKSNKQNVLDR